MGCSTLKKLVIVVLVIVLGPAVCVGSDVRPEVDVLMDVRNALDPQGRVLVSWKQDVSPCSGSFEGILCEPGGRVANISLQGRELTGYIPMSLSQLPALSGLFLQYNKLWGTIPSNLSSLTNLTDLYLNNNTLSGAIPPEIGQLSNLQVLELGDNKLAGQIPVELGNLTRLRVLALNDNHLTGTIPASFGNLTVLASLDVSQNNLTGTIPASIANLPSLILLDVHNNSLTGPVPDGLSRLQSDFIYGNNSVGLCGTSNGLKACTSSPSSSGNSFNLNLLLSVATAIVLAIGGSALLILIFICARRRRAKLRLKFAGNHSPNLKPVKIAGTTTEKVEKSDSSISPRPQNGTSFRSTPDLSVLGRSRVMSDRSTSTIASKGPPSPSEWSSWIHLDELETATNYFSEKNLIRKNVHTAIYRGTLRDGTVVAVKAIYNTRFSFGEQDFQMGIEGLMQVKHENLVSFLGFCCSKGGSECYLVYDYVSNGSLEHHMHGKSKVLINWSSRVNIIRGIARGLAYLHDGADPVRMLHQNLWAGNVLLDSQGNALLSDYGLSEIVAEEVMYSKHKTLAALGYLAPEYAYTGQLTEEADVYAFGALVLELLTGHRPVFLLPPDARTLANCASGWVKPLLELGKVREFVDPQLNSNFSLAGAAGLAHIALQCMAEDPYERPSMADVVRRLDHASEGWADMAIDSFLLAATPAFARQPSFPRQDSSFDHYQCR